MRVHPDANTILYLFVFLFRFADGGDICSVLVPPPMCALVCPAVPAPRAAGARRGGRTGGEIGARKQHLPPPAPRCCWASSRWRAQRAARPAPRPRGTTAAPTAHTSRRRSWRPARHGARRPRGSLGGGAWERRASPGRLVYFADSCVSD
ncbi:hypothetical protein PVAP13_6NG320200 [Panicum virgatum]|uniref:Uncharacterized protein n=1 Tax=Panicum virgatum TaxID=38727 RepID=A0A8T0R3J1_PANVG|nr:hypothetical protein PVAP13_6NG320200 [Panicum virgatum]